MQYVCLRKQDMGTRPTVYYLTTTLELDKQHLRTFIVPANQDVQDYWKAFDEALGSKSLSMTIPVPLLGSGKMMVYMSRDESTILNIFDEKAKMLTI